MSEDLFILVGPRGETTKFELHELRRLVECVDSRVNWLRGESLHTEADIIDAISDKLHKALLERHQ